MTVAETVPALGKPKPEMTIDKVLETHFAQPDKVRYFYTGGYHHDGINRLPSPEAILGALHERNEFLNQYGWQVGTLLVPELFDHPDFYNPEYYGYAKLEIPRGEHEPPFEAYYLRQETPAASERRIQLQNEQLKGRAFPVLTQQIPTVVETVRFFAPPLTHFDDPNWYKRDLRSAPTLEEALKNLIGIGFLSTEDLKDIQLFEARLLGLVKAVNDWFGQYQFISLKDLQRAMSAVLIPQETIKAPITVSVEK